MISHGCPNVSKSPQVSRTLLSILADLSNAVVWVVSTRPSISSSSSLLAKLLMTVPSTRIIIGITVNFISHNILSSLASPCLSFHFLWFSLIYFFVSFPPTNVSRWIFAGVWVTDKFSQVSRTLLSILAVFKDAVGWVVSICPLVSKSSCPITNSFGIVLIALIKIGITVTFPIP